MEARRWPVRQTRRPVDPGVRYPPRTDPAPTGPESTDPVWPAWRSRGTRRCRVCRPPRVAPNSTPGRPGHRGRAPRRFDRRARRRGRASRAAAGRVIPGTTRPARPRPAGRPDAAAHRRVRWWRRARRWGLRDPTRAGRRPANAPAHPPADEAERSPHPSGRSPQLTGSQPDAHRPGGVGRPMGQRRWPAGVPTAGAPDRGAGHGTGARPPTPVAEPGCPAAPGRRRRSRLRAGRPGRGPYHPPVHRTAGHCGAGQRGRRTDDRRGADHRVDAPWSTDRRCGDRDSPRCWCAGSRRTTPAARRCSVRVDRTTPWWRSPGRADAMPTRRLRVGVRHRVPARRHAPPTSLQTRRDRPTSPHRRRHLPV